MLNREKNRLRNEKWGVCQNITKFMVGVDGWKSSDIVVKCESCLATVNDCKLLQICYHSSTASEKFFVEKTIVQTLWKWWGEIFSGSSRTIEKRCSTNNFKKPQISWQLKRKSPSRICKDLQSCRRKEKKKRWKIKGEEFTTEGMLAYRKTHPKRASCNHKYQ